MSRKHYRKIADVIAGETSRYLNGERSVTARTQYYTARNIAFSLADMFKCDNYNFDRARFYAACGIEEYA